MTCFVTKIVIAIVVEYILWLVGLGKAWDSLSLLRQPEYCFYK